jgi:outer membrane protein
MLKWLSAFLFVFCTIFTANTFAAEMRIGFVDVVRVLRESAPAVKVGKKLDREFEGRQVEFKKIAAQGKALQQLLDKGTFTDADRRLKERELIKLNQDFQRMQRELNEDMNTRRNEELSGLQERLNGAIAQVAISEKYDLILQEASWFNPRIDITEKVIKLLADK